MSVIHFPSRQPMNIKNIIKHCKNKSLIGEMGGSVTPNGFMDECWGRKFENGRFYIDLNDIKKIHGHTRNLVTWHMHPHVAAWWPSSENIITTTRNFDLPGILFTTYGTWIYYKTDKFKNNNKGIKNAVENMQKQILKQIIHPHFIIQKFTDTLKNIGITVFFYTNDQNGQNKVCNFIKTIPQLKNLDTKPINLNNIVLQQKSTLKSPGVKRS